MEIRPVGGAGLFTAHTSEPNWKLAHKILMPALAPQAIGRMFPAMMDISSQLILRWERFVGDEIDVCDNLTRLTLDTIAVCSFNSFYQKSMHRFVDAMISVLTESGRRAQRLSLQNALMIGTTRRFNEDVSYLHQLCDEIVKERREHHNKANDLLNSTIRRLAIDYLMRTFVIKCSLSHCWTRDHLWSPLVYDIISSEESTLSKESSSRSRSTR